LTVPTPTLSPTLSLHDALPILPGASSITSCTPVPGCTQQPNIGGDSMAQVRVYNLGFDPETGIGELLHTTSVRHAFGMIRREVRSEEHTSELQSRENLVCRLLL